MTSDLGGRVWHITGARPNFPKAAPVLRALDALGVEQSLVHTGQHYDPRLSDVFFTQLGLPEPDVNLGIGSGRHGAQTGAIMTALEDLLERERPSLVVVYGDVNSTVAAALVATKMGIDVAHVEAGLRSFDRTMPEEVNRLVTDRLSDLLFTTSEDADQHLLGEGVAREAIHFVGNPMIDTLLRHLDALDAPGIAAELGLDGSYVAATLHRPGNVDDPRSVAAVVEAVHRVADLHEVVVPLHPRGRQALESAGLSRHPQVTVVEPLGYLEFLSLVQGSHAVVTDSGGVQEETTILDVPCFTLRPNTERPVTITHGTNRLVTTATVAQHVADLGQDPAPSDRRPPLWDGHAGERIAAVVAEHLD